MKTVKIKKGWQFKIAGKPSHRIETRPAMTHVAAVPGRIPFVKPRLLVNKGDSVRIGTVLFEDKKHPDVKFLSPGSGTISDIIYGPRRVIEKIVIAVNENPSHEPFTILAEQDLDRIGRDALISNLMAGGMWPFLRQLPFRNIVDPKSRPGAVWVMLGSADPFQPTPRVYLEGQMASFEFAIRALRRLADTVNICWFDDNAEKYPVAEKFATHRVRGNYPASDAGVVLYHTKKSASENRDWYIDGQDLVLIGKFLRTGRYPIDRIVTLSNGSAENSCHITTCMGVRLNDLLPDTLNPRPLRWVVGGIFSGYTSAPENFLDLYQTSVMIIEDAHESEMFGFLRPGLKKLSNSRTVLSSALARPLPVNADMHGEKRPCINCGYCATICPVDILPQYTFKSIDADEIEEALAGGLLDCVECGLCSFVCPSKIELADILVRAKHRYHKELTEVV